MPTQVGGGLELAFVLLLGQGLDAGDGIGDGEIVLFLALFRDGHLVHHGVQALGLQGGENAVPLGRLQLDLDPELVRQGFGEFHLEAGQLAVFVHIAERWVGAFQADVDDSGILDFLQLLAGNRLPHQSGTQGQAQCANQQIATQYGKIHDKPLCVFLCTMRVELQVNR